MTTRQKSLTDEIEKLLRPRKVKVIAGPHKGRTGNVVSVPWLFNLWHLRMTLNVPKSDEEYARREWIAVWSWQTQDVQH